MPRWSLLPFLFRRSSDDYILKDITYVHGMTNEWAIGESGGAEEEIFIA